MPSAIVHLGIDIEADDLAKQLTEVMRNDDVIELVKAIDEHVAEWDFTLKLCEHFDKLKKEHEREEAEDAKKEHP